MKPAPLLPSERIVTIDVLRGFALLGILVVNMEMFSHPIQRIVLPIDPATGAVDRVADWLVRCFGEGKFYSLFSLLFGLGFGLQLLRAEERGSGIALLFRRGNRRKFLGPLAAAGRLPLSNYLLQSVICTMLFYSYGLGLFGQVGKAAGVGLAAIIYALLLGLSVWWSARFQFGPAEWLWRALTYKAAPPMRIDSSRRG